MKTVFSSIQVKSWTEFSIKLMFKRFYNYRWIPLHFWNGTSWEI